MLLKIKMTYVKCRRYAQQYASRPLAEGYHITMVRKPLTTEAQEVMLL